MGCDRLHRGVTGSLPAGVEVLHADRTSEAALAAAIGDGSWDLVVDTWAGSPPVAGISARALHGRADRFGYVSSASVYVWGEHVNELSPVVFGDPRAEDGDYAALKRGAELAVLEHFGDALLARAGLILGPHEDIGRLPWWLDRISRGGRVVAPGRPYRPVQYVDARDLAAWLLTALAAGVEPWTQLPCWVPESGEFVGFFDKDTTRAAATGLVCRPVEQTVTDTWEWLQGDGMPGQRADRPVHGLPTALEQQLLANH